MIKHSYVDIEGYHLKKKYLEKDEIKKLKKELTVSPNNNMYTDDEVKYEQYTETEKEIIIPRYYGIKKYGEPSKYKFEGAQEDKINFTSELRDYQVNIVDKTLEHIKKYGGGHISVPCGRGKTVMAINIAHRLGLRTLILVHASFLQDQWVDRISHFTGEEVGIIRQDKIKIENKKIVVGMIQSISKRDYGDIFDQFGLVICDECHHYASKYFSLALTKLGAKYTLGLSATLYRKDGLIKVVHWYLGDVAYKEGMRTNNQVVVKMLNYNSEHKKFRETTKMVKGIRMPNCTKMINNLVDLKKRNKLIIDLINILRKDPDRKILILSERNLSHLPVLKDEVDKLIQEDVEKGIMEKDEYKTYYYTGPTKAKDKLKAETDGDIIFGTYQMAQEGLDIPKLNTVILATPKKDVVQAVGRILRKELKNGGVRPLIIDICDNMSIFPKQADVREKFYENNDYIINYYYLLENKLLSPKQYLELQGRDEGNVCDKVPDGLSEVLSVPPVEIIECDDEKSISSNSSGSTTSRRRRKKKEYKNLDDCDFDDIFGNDDNMSKNKNKKEDKIKLNDYDFDDVFQ